MTIFEERYKKLNPAQKKAVDTIDGPVMVIAGPGTGKTTILTLRIANILLKTDTPPSGILAITFTDAGVKAMKEKLREIIGSRADEVKIHTFHSFAAGVIAEFGEYFVHLHDFVQMTPIDQAELIRELLTKKEFSDLRPLGNPDFYIGPILETIRDAKREAVTPEMLRDFAKSEIKRIERDETSISSRGESKGELKALAKRAIEKCERTVICANLYSAYEEQKKTKKLMDFDDLILELILALRENINLLRNLQEKYLYILVDEHQDTNDSQNLIIKFLADFFENPNVFIVGDEKQAIYRFQGASVENFLRFEKIWKDMTLISLQENFRSHQQILDATFRMIEGNYNEGENEHLRIKLKASSKEKGKPIEILNTGNTASAESFLIKELKRIQSKEPDKNVAIISRTNRDVERIIKICENEGITVSSERSIDIFSHPIGNLFFSLLEYLLDPLNDEALGKTLIALMWGANLGIALDLIKKIRKGEIENIENEIPALKEIRNEMVTDSPIAFIMFASEKSGFMEIASRDPSFIEVWRGILGLAERIQRENNINDPILLIEKLLAYKNSTERRTVKVSVGVESAQIKVMTAHGSKGLEFDYVFIPYGTEESWKSRSKSSYFVLPMTVRANEENDIRDARRLFYVALTRAKKHIWIMVPGEDAGNLLTPLRFLSELDQRKIFSIEVPLPKKPLALSIKNQITRDEKLLNYIKETILKNGISVTALNHFIECPSKFIYRSIFKIPEAPKVMIEKGNAMHKAFAKIWTDKDKSFSNIQNIIESTVKEYVSKTLLKSFEKEALIGELLENAPYVAKCLQDHFNQKGKIYAETWSEHEFNVSEQKIKIKLHGKFDVLIDTEKEVCVFDYKTRGKMSVNQIKGETKARHGADGGYFRQMVFYKLLLENDYRFNSKTSRKEIIPSLVFLTPDEKKICHIVTIPVLKEDVEKLKSEIKSLIYSVWSGKILEDWCMDEACENCSLKKLHR